MYHRIGLALLFCVSVSPFLLGEDQRAKTTDGKEVILRDDGTWSYVKDTRKNIKAQEAYRGKRGTFALSLPPNVWKKSQENSNPNAEVEFVHQDGDVMAMVIAERLSVPKNALKKAVLENLRKIDKQAEIVEDTNRTVNGVEVSYLMVNAKVQGIPFSYLYYIYSGEAGSIQLLTFTGQNLFKEYKSDMEAFLNGFEVIKK